MEHNVGFQFSECRKLAVDERLRNFFRSEKLRPVPSKVVRYRYTLHAWLSWDDVEPSVCDLIFEPRAAREEVDL